MSTLFAALRTERGRHVARGVFLAGFSATFLFCGYEFIRSPAESIFMAHFSAADKPYALSVVPFFMAALIYLYGRSLSAFGGSRTMVGSMLASAAGLVGLYFAVGVFGKPAAFLLYVFKEAYVVIISEQYWSFINSVLRDEEGKVFNGPVAGLGALGSLLGGFFLSRYVASFGTEAFILFSAVMFFPAAVLIRGAYKEAGEPQPSREEAGGRLGHVHLSILRQNRTVLFIALVIFSTQVVATMLDMRFSLLVQDAMPDKDLRTAYLGSFWMWVNSFSFSMQFILAPLLLRWVPTRGIQAAIPAVHIVACALLLLAPSLGLAAGAFLLFKGMDYSIFRASKETLYIPFSYDTRYRAKQVADAFTYRFSKGFTSIVLSMIKASGGMPAGAYAGAALVFAAAWLGLSFPMTAKRETAAA
ncbi:MAG: hypothetical protein RDU13_02890 [Elusimicrobiales bacterium]|nr:hypothetical protein [Elusimicrobiales bacterium]